jgi:protein-S-isoprenylcysteine O-methyltransferase Ste14
MLEFGKSQNRSTPRRPWTGVKRCFGNSEVRSRLEAEAIFLKLNFITLAILTVAALLFATRISGHVWTAPQIVGLAIAVPAFVMFVLARIELGRAFSVRAKASTLVTTGIYSRIRNPIYVSGWLIALGMIILARQPWWLLILAVIIPLQVYRVHNEERVLEDKFGAEYLEYKRRTWF